MQQIDPDGPSSNGREKRYFDAKEGETFFMQGSQSPKPVTAHYQEAPGKDRKVIAGKESGKGESEYGHEAGAIENFRYLYEENASKTKVTLWNIAEQGKKQKRNKKSEYVRYGGGDFPWMKVHFILKEGRQTCHRLIQDAEKQRRASDPV